MQEILITNIQRCPVKDAPQQIEAIFFESSTKKTFETLKEREEFQWKYLGYYLHKFPDLAFCAQSDDKILGYILGATSSNEEDLYRIQPHMRLFEACFTSYPAHLHINCHREARGMGIGSKLIEKLVFELQVLKTSGLHIMTGPDSQNRSFYQKLGFNFEQLELHLGHPILLMGKSLTALVKYP